MHYYYIISLTESIDNSNGPFKNIAVDSYSTVFTIIHNNTVLQ